MCDSDEPLSPNDEALFRDFIEKDGPDEALWQKYVHDEKWPFDLVQSVDIAQELLYRHSRLDRAYLLSRAVFPVLVKTPDAPYPDPLWWPRSVCSLARAAVLADGRERAERWIDQALRSAKRHDLPPRAIDLLMMEYCYVLVLAGSEEERRLACASVLKVLDDECRRWTNLACCDTYDFMLLLDIAVRLCDLCLWSSACKWNPPTESREAALALYKMCAESPPWPAPRSSSDEADVLRVVLRHLAAAAYFFGAPTIRAEDREIELHPHWEFELALVEFHGARDRNDLVSAADRFIQSLCEWRAIIASPKIRRGLRQHLSAFSEGILTRLREELREADSDHGMCDLLSEAEEILGPSRWLEERIAEGIRPTEDVPIVLRRQSDAGRAIFGSRGRVIRLLEDGDDLIVVSRAWEQGQGVPTGAAHHRVLRGARRLSEAYSTTFGGSGEVTETLSKVNRAREQGKFDEYECFRQRLHVLVDDLSFHMADILEPAREAFSTERPTDTLLVCPLPYMFNLPWSLVPMGERRLIENVASLTLSSSIGASAALAEIAAGRDSRDPFVLSAYCDCGDDLRWERLVKDSSERPAGLAKLAMDGKIELRTVGIAGHDNQVLDAQTLDSYPDREATVLLVAGHGDPKRGLRIGQEDYWDPRQLGEKWRLRRTECAIVPSCCLGELLMDGDDPGNPIRSEVTGFVAGLCLAQVPRVLACPWTAFDVTVCTRINRIVDQAVRLRAEKQPHYWARALRQVVADNIASPESFQPYDDANLIVFGAP